MRRSSSCHPGPHPAAPQAKGTSFREDGRAGARGWLKSGDDPTNCATGRKRTALRGDWRRTCLSPIAHPLSSRSMSVRMSDDEITAFLAEQITMTLVTLGPDGWPLTTPLWFAN